MKKEYIRFNPEIKRFIRVGTPIAFQEILTQLSFLALCAFINRLGLDAASGSMASFVAQNVGAGQEKRAKKAMVTGMLIGCGIGIFIAAFSFIRGDLPAALFSNDAAVIARAAEYLKGFAPEAFVTSILFSFVGYYNGHSKTLFVMLQGIAQTFIVRLPMSYFMSIQPDASLTMIGLAAPCATIFGIIINLIYFARVNREIRSQKF